MLLTDICCKSFIVTAFLCTLAHEADVSKTNTALSSIQEYDCPAQQLACGQCMCLSHIATGTQCQNVD